MNVLIADANAFNRGLIAEILRTLGVISVASARNAETAMTTLIERPIDVILLSGDDTAALDALSFTRDLRRYHDSRLQHLPVVLVASGLTRQLVIGGRDAGVDEFLNKPISPTALRQRLEMVIETPRPFIDSDVYLGPCRRRKNPADYHGARRRAGERATPRAPLIDQDDIARETPVRVALTKLRKACAELVAGNSGALAAVRTHITTAKGLAAEAQDQALRASLGSFEACLDVASPLGQLDEDAIMAAITALEQLAALPLAYIDARDSVVLALGKTLQKKLAA